MLYVNIRFLTVFFYKYYFYLVEKRCFYCGREGGGQWTYNILKVTYVIRVVCWPLSVNIDSFLTAELRNT